MTGIAFLVIGLLQDPDLKHEVEGYILRMKVGLKERRDASRELASRLRIYPLMRGFIHEAIESEKDGRIKSRLEWVLEHGGFRPAFKLDVGNSVEYASISGNLVVYRTRWKIVAYDLANRKPAWEFPLPDNVSYGPLAVGSKVVAISGSNGQTLCLSREKGDRLLSAFAPFQGEKPILSGKMWVLPGGAGITAFNAETREKGWLFPLRSRAVVANASFVYALEGDSKIRALDSTNAKEKWSAEVPFVVERLCHFGERVYAIGTGRIAAFDAKVGQALWDFKELAVLNDCVSTFEDAVFAVTPDQALLCLDASKGTIRWKRTRPSSETREWLRRPALQTGHLVFLQHPGGLIQMVYLKDGKPVDKVPPINGGRVACSGAGWIVIQKGKGLHFYKAK